jgi:hypothetical protein
MTTMASASKIYNMCSPSSSARAHLQMFTGESLGEVITKARKVKAIMTFLKLNFRFGDD